MSTRAAGATGRLSITSITCRRSLPSMRKPLYTIEKDAQAAAVCVTGGTGYIAGVIIARLLAAGHTVHATVRDPNNEQKLRWLQGLPHASTHLKFFKVALCMFQLCSAITWPLCLACLKCDYMSSKVSL